MTPDSGVMVQGAGDDVNFQGTAGAAIRDCNTGGAPGGQQISVANEPLKDPAAGGSQGGV